MTEWIEHDGKGVPVGAETIVDVAFPDGQICSSQRATHWLPDDEDKRNYWVHDANDPMNDITQFRVVG